MWSQSSSKWVETGPGFWNLHVPLRMGPGGVVDISTHMSAAALPNGRFLIVDAAKMDAEQKKQFDEVSQNGELIDAVIFTHPFHTLAILPAFVAAYPACKVYGMPRHLRIFPDIPWAGCLDKCTTRKLWEPDVVLSIPNGVQYDNPIPNSTNHFACCWVFHRASKTVHVDDSVNCWANPGLLIRFALGAKRGRLQFHRSLVTGAALLPEPGSAEACRTWFSSTPLTWDFDSLVTAHDSGVLGGARQQLRELLEAPATDAMFKRIAWNPTTTSMHNALEADGEDIPTEGDECG